MGRIKELIVFHNTLIKKEKYYFVFRKKKNHDAFFFPCLLMELLELFEIDAW